jgi:large subunit ribosomal protein L6
VSKIGKKPVKLGEDIQAVIEANQVTLKGSRGSLSLAIPDSLDVVRLGDSLVVKKKTDVNQARADHGTVRQLLASMAKGVTQGWSKKLQVVGTGYVAQKKGQGLNLSLGLSHQIDFPAPDGIQFEVEGDVISVIGFDKQRVGEVAYQIRSLRPPDAYKGKGIRYLDEEIKLKPGKAAKVGESGGE